MADRTVTTRLKLSVADWTTGKNAVKRDLKDLNRQFADSAGAAAGFRKKLEDATARLPKIEIDANSSAAEIKLAGLRSDLEKLAAKRVGIDIDAGDALAEMARLQAELAALEDGASFEVRASVQEALNDLAQVDAEVARLVGERPRITVDVDTRGALAGLGKIGAGMAALGTGVPVVASLGAGAVALGSSFAAAGAGAVAFSTVATAAMERVTEAVDSQDYSKLSPAEFDLAQEWQTFSNVYLAWQRSLNPQVIPAISTGLGLMGSTLPKISPLVAGTAGAFTTLGREAQTALNGPFWDEFLTNIGVAGPQAVLGFGRSFGNVAGGVAGVINAFLPWQGTVVGGLEDATAKFREWGQSLDSNPQFKEFMAYVEQHAPEVWALIKNLASALLNVGEAVVPLGVGSMAGINLLATIVAGMDPQHIQLIAAAIIAVKVAQGGLAVASFWGDLTGKLDGLGRSADGAKGKLAGLASSLAAGGVAALVGAAAIAVDKLTDELSGLNPNIDELAKRTVDLAQKGAPANVMLSQFSTTLDTLAGDMGRSATWFAPAIGQFESLSDTVQRLTSGGVLDGFATGIGDMVSSVTGDLYTMDTGVQRLGNVDKTLAQMVQSGNGQQAAALFNELAKQSGLAGADVDKLKALLPEYSGAITAAHQPTASTGDALKDLGTSASTAAGNITTLRGAIGQLVGITTNAMTAEIGYKQALDDATAAAKANGEATSTNTQKGRDNREALIALAQSANTYRQALVDQGVPLDQVNSKLGSQRAAFQRAAEAMGFSKKEAQDLATKLGLIPGNVKTDVKTPGGREALALIKEYEAKLRALDGKNITNTITTIRYTREQILQKNREVGAIDYYESGGIRAFASGGMTTGPRPGPHIATRPTVLYGEGRAPEAFIPYDTAFRQRAVGLLGQVADDFGLSLYNKEAALQARDLTGGLKEANTGISTSLAAATTTLDETLGSAGTLTGAIVNVGDVGQDLTAGWVEGSTVLGDSVTDMGVAVKGAGTTVSTSLGELGDTVQNLAAVIGEAASWTAGASKGKGSPPPVQTGDKYGPTDAEIRARMKKAPPTQTGDKYGPSDAEIRRRLAAQAAVVPGGSLREVNSGGSAGVSAPVNTSRVSRPQAMPSGGFVGGSYGSGGGTAFTGGRSSAGSGGAPVINVDMSNSVIREPTDVPKLAAQFGFEYTSRA